MKSFCIFVSLLFFLFSLPSYSANPCNSDGTLKRWAIKRGYTEAYCANTGGDSGETTDTTTTDGRDPCEGGSLKGWARKAGYSAEDCAVSEPPVVNTPPTLIVTSPISGASIQEGGTFDLSATASDAEQGDLSSSVQWRSSIDGVISSGSGLSVGQHTLTAQVADAEGLLATSSVGVTVEAVVVVNEAPVIVISNPSSNSTVLVGGAIALVAEAIDPEDGDLTSTVTWFSSLDQMIPSTPILSLGVHSITATVVDREGLTSTANISINVEPSLAGVGKVTISWTPPSQRANGDALVVSEIGGYEIFMVAQAGSEERVVSVDGASVTSYTFEQLPSGTYHFAVSTFDITGLRGRMSEAVTAEVP